MLNNMQGACSGVLAVSKFNLYNMQRINLCCQCYKTKQAVGVVVVQSTEHNKSLAIQLGRQ